MGDIVWEITPCDIWPLFKTTSVPPWSHSLFPWWCSVQCCNPWRAWCIIGMSTLVPGMHTHTHAHIQRYFIKCPAAISIVLNAKAKLYTATWKKCACTHTHIHTQGFLKWLSFIASRFFYSCKIPELVESRYSRRLPSWASLQRLNFFNSFHVTYL